MKNRFLSILVALLIVVGSFSINLFGVSAISIVSGDFMYHALEDGTVQLEAYFGKAADVVIPDTIDGKTISAIGFVTFPETVKTVDIPASVTKISDVRIFAHSMTSISVDENNKHYSSENGVLFNKDKTEILKYPEANANTSYQIPETVVKIGDFAFNWCEKLTSITIPDDVTYIGDRSFYFCSGVKSIALPKSLLSIGFEAFAYCGIETISIPAAVTKIEDDSFEHCDNLASVTVDENSKHFSSVDGVMFNKDKTQLLKFPEVNSATKYDIPNTVKQIGGYAFYLNRNLTEITVPSSVTSIGSMAFSGCYSLLSMDIPISVTAIDYGAFEYSESLTISCYANSAIHKYAVENDIKCLLKKSDEIGDCNNDAKINMADVLILRKYLAKWNVVINTANADCNADTKINMADVLLLRKYLAKWDVVLGK